MWWTTEVGIAFSRLEEGYENAMKEYNKKQVCSSFFFEVFRCLFISCFCLLCFRIVLFLVFFLINFFMQSSHEAYF